jgi:hypothetical protein
MDEAEKVKIRENLIDRNLKLNVKSDSVNFNTLVNTSFRCPVKSCKTQFENMNQG